MGADGDEDVADDGDKIEDESPASSGEIEGEGGDTLEERSLFVSQAERSTTST